MNDTATLGDDRIVDVRELNPRVRHAVILQLFDHLGRGGSIQLISDHPPAPLRVQLEARYGCRCAWTYLERGPDIWRVRLLRA